MILALCLFKGWVNGGLGSGAEGGSVLTMVGLGEESSPAAGMSVRPAAAPPPGGQPADPCTSRV